MPTALRRLFRRVPALLTAMVLLASTFLPAGVALAAEQTGNGLDLAEALATLQEYGLVRGDPSGNLRLADPITRAEMTTILVRALGHEQEALFLAGAAPFADVRNHWSAGYLAVAKSLGLVGGYPDGRFRPDQPVTYAEALAMLLRLVKQNPTSGGWPDGVLNQALRVGIAPPGVPLFVRANTPAIRLDVFSSLYLAVSQVPDPATGKTVLQTLDTEPPALTVADVPASTDAQTVTISGSVSGANKVTVAGKPVPLTEQGRFAATVDLKLGSNMIEVRAVDRAGNATVRQVTVERVQPVVRLVIDGPVQLQAGTSARYIVKGYDAAGRELPVPGATLQVSGSAATYNPQTLTLTAGPNPGRVTLTATYHNLTATLAVDVVGLAPQARALRISGPDTLVEGRKYTLRVEVLDADGNVVTADFGRSVTLTANDQDVFIAPNPSQTANGVAAFDVLAKSPGTVTFTATAAGLASDSETVTFRSPIAVQLQATPSSVSAGGSTRIRAYLVDEDGNVITNNTGKDIEIQLAVSGDADLDTDEIAIPRGHSSSSGYDANLSVGWDSRSVTVRGWVVSDHDYTVEPVSVRVSTSSGSGGSGGSTSRRAAELRVGPPGIRQVSDEGLFLIQVVDRNGYPVAEDYAFRLKITTSNNEPQVNGIPVGPDGKPVLELRFGTAYNINPTQTTVRTHNGAAFVYVKYNRSGSVTITPVPATGGSAVPDDSGVEGRASSSSGLKMTAGTGYYQGDIHHVRLRVLSPVSKEWSEVGGVVRNSTSETVKLRVEAVDAAGNVLYGYKGDVTLTQTGSATKPSKTFARMVNGVAEFTVSASTKASTDTYVATFKDAENQEWRSNEVRIAVQDSSSKTLIRPAIHHVVGVNNGVEGKKWDVVQPTDQAMRIYLVKQDDGLVAVKVYRGTSLVWTSPVIDISAEIPYVDVPRSVLPSPGSYKFRVQIVNAVGASEQSLDRDRDVRILGYSSASITGVAVDGSQNKLILTGRNLNKEGTIDPSKLRVINPTTHAEVALDGADWTISSPSTVEVELTVPDLGKLLPPDRFYGPNVYLSAQTGWYVDPNDYPAPADLTDNKVEPLAWVERAELDLKGRRIYLYGKGFSTGTVSSATVAATMSVEQPSTEPDTKQVLALKDYVEKVDLVDTRIVIYLKSGFAEEFDKRFSGGGVVLTANAGWLIKGQGSALGFSIALPQS